MTHRKSILRLLSFLLLCPCLMAGLAGCQAQPSATYPTNTYAFELPTATLSLSTPGPVETLPAEDPTLTPTALIVPTRALPESFNWKEMPAQPQISQTAVQIYMSGIARGRDPRNISVVGDCQAIPYVFLGKYGIRQYTLDAEYYLEEMISFYRPSFAREGYAVRGGFTAASVFSPAQADPAACMPGETPLDCEWRIQNPSIAFINMETWQIDGTVDRYEAYLRRIVEFSISRGTLPILITKADMAEAKTPVINPAMARVAYEYDVPLVNFWQSAQFLENRGIDPQREGFHLTEAGYDLKQKLALLILYDLWTRVRPDTLEIQQENTDLIPAPQSGSDRANPPTLTFHCGGNCVYFDLYQTSNDGVRSAGIYELDIETSQLRLISSPGMILQDTSADGRQLLISSSSGLYIASRDSNTLSWIADELYEPGSSSAYFDTSGRFVTALLGSGGQARIARFDRQDLSQPSILIEAPSAIRLITYRPQDSFYWQSGSCSGLEFCQTEDLWKTDPATGMSERIDDKVNLAFSPAGTGLAFQDPHYTHEANGFHNPVLFYEDTLAGITSRRMFQFDHPGGFMVHPQVAAYAFSPDGSRIFILYDQYSDYFERSMTLIFYLEDLLAHQVLAAGKMIGGYGSLMPLAVWSPQGDSVLLLFTSTGQGTSYQLEFFEKDTLRLASEPSLLIEPLILQGYSFPRHAFWVNP